MDELKRKALLYLRGKISYEEFCLYCKSIGYEQSVLEKRFPKKLIEHVYIYWTLFTVLLILLVLVFVGIFYSSNDGFLGWINFFYPILFLGLLSEYYYLNLDFLWGIVGLILLCLTETLCSYYIYEVTLNNFYIQKSLLFLGLVFIFFITKMVFFPHLTLMMKVRD